MRADENCMLTIPEESTRFSNHNLQQFRDCKDHYVPDCGDDALCQDFVNRFQACINLTDEFSVTKDGRCTNCKSWLKNAKANQRLPVTCIQCYTSCVETVQSVPQRSIKFELYIAPTYLQCIQYGEFSNSTIKLYSTKASAKACESQTCNMYGDPCAFADDKLVCQQQMNDFYICSEADPLGQCSYAQNDFLKAQAFDSYPYSYYMCRMGCFPNPRVIDRAVSVYQRCISECMLSSLFFYDTK
jgi:hypothetical protein